jgi:polyisoprenoid-binding protein YceI
VPAFNEHLRSADFFEAETYPEVTFRSTKVEAAGEDGLQVTGDLTIKGITRPVVLDVTLNKAAEQPMAKRQAIGFDAITTVKRTDFGLGMFAPNVSDEVTLRITTEAIVPKAEASE